jgi:hypothetical protein
MRHVTMDLIGRCTLVEPSLDQQLAMGALAGLAVAG